MKIKTNRMKYFTPKRQKKLNCQCCGKQLTRNDRSQDQHIFPNWWYNLIPKNIKGQFILNIVELISNNSVETIIEGRHSNFWCNECEDNSSILDSQAKDILFGPSRTLSPGITLFDHLGYNLPISISGYNSIILARWIRSLILRVLINETSSSDFINIKKEFYVGMLQSNPNLAVKVGLDPSGKFDTLYPTTVHLDKQFAGLHIQIGSLHGMVILPFTEELIKNPPNLQSNGITLPCLDTRGTIIPLIPDLNITTLQSFVLELKNPQNKVLQNPKHPALTIIQIVTP